MELFVDILYQIVVEGIFHRPKLFFYALLCTGASCLLFVTIEQFSRDLNPSLVCPPPADDAELWVLAGFVFAPPILLLVTMVLRSKLVILAKSVKQELLQFASISIFFAVLLLILYSIVVAPLGCW